MSVEPTKKCISIVVPCFNEVENVKEVYRRGVNVMEQESTYRYEFIFIDNASTDGTADVLRRMAREDRKVRVILNTRNFGIVRSPFHGLMQANADAVVLMSADVQEPPETIPAFLRKWENGYKIVAGVRVGSEDTGLLYGLRKLYYRLASRIADVPLIQNFMGFGLYDRDVIRVLRRIKDPYPHLRGLLCEVGFEAATVEYVQSARKRGASKTNLYTLYGLAMLGITSHSKVPLRLAALVGFVCAYLSLLVAVGYFVYKLLFWQSFSLGQAPLVIGIFFFSSVQLIFLGIIGEYIGAIHTQVLNRPLVIEKERINFD